MKQAFIGAMYLAPQANEMAATETAATVVPVPETFESEALSKIRSELSATIAKLQAGNLPVADIVALSGEIGKLQSGEAAEIANIKKQRAEAALAELSAKRVSEANAIIDSFLSANEAAKLAAADKKMSIDDKNAANSAAISEREKLVNLLIGKSPKIAAIAGAAKTASVGASDSEIQAKYLAYTNSGIDEKTAKSNLETIDGFAKSTIWFAVDRLKNPAKYAK